MATRLWLEAFIIPMQLITVRSWTGNCGVQHSIGVVTKVIQHEASASYVEQLSQTSTACPGGQELEEPECPQAQAAPSPRPCDGQGEHGAPQRLGW